MLLFGLLFLHALVAGRHRLACVPLALSLLSKETAAVLPAIGVAYEHLVVGGSWRSTLRRTAGHWLVLAGWALCHPTLRSRLLTFAHDPGDMPSRLPWPEAFFGTAMAQMNVDRWPAPEAGWSRALIAGVATVPLLLGILFVTSRRAGAPPTRAKEAATLRLGIVWAGLGWSVLLLPSIGWHAYYGVLGTLGFWMVVGVVLSRSRGAALALVASLAVLRSAQIDTPSWDWGTGWYQFRAGTILGSIRESLLGLHPSLPRGSRLFFARIPNDVGFLSGDGPAVRVWYDDPSLRAMYYSAYAPRTPETSPGRDFFFRFDTVQVLVEVHAGPGPLLGEMKGNPDWQHDHEVLASLFIHTGDLAAGAVEYAKLAHASPDRPDYALYAGAAHEAIGRMEEGRRFYQAAARAYGDVEVRRRAGALLSALRSQDP